MPYATVYTMMLTHGITILGKKNQQQAWFFNADDAVYLNKVPQASCFHTFRLLWWSLVMGWRMLKLASWRWR